MRNIIKIIDAMLEVIPETETEFISGLKSVRQSACFSPPEIMSLRWRTAAEVLGDYVPQEDEKCNEWQLKVVSIWFDKE